MKKGMLAVLVGLAVMAMAASVFADANWNLTGQGARSLGMGGAFIGIADDATAISWNPAGLAQLDRPELSAVAKLENHKQEWSPKTFTQTGGIRYDWSSATNSNTHFGVSFVSGVYPIKVAKRNLTLALAYQQQLDFYSFNTDTSRNIKDEQTGGAYTISPGLAYQILPQLGLGAAVNIWTSSSNFEHTNKINPSFDYTRKEPYSGLNFLIGAQAKVKPVKFGAVLRTPFTLKYHQEYSGPGAGTTTRSPVTGDWEQKLPVMFGFGMAVEPTKGFTLAADLDFRPYSNMEVFDSKDTTGQLVEDTTAKFENVTQIRLGAEYLLMLSQAIVPLRVGFRTDPKTYTGWIITPPGQPNKRDKQVVGTSFTFGTGVAVKHFQLDGAFEYATSKVPNKYDTLWGLTPSTLNWKATYMRWLMSAIFKF